MNKKLQHAKNRNILRRASPEDRARIARAVARDDMRERYTPKPLPKQRVRRRYSGGKPWPYTDDQRAQSRPLIVVKPLRAIMKAGLVRAKFFDPSRLGYVSKQTLTEFLLAGEPLYV